MLRVVLADDEQYERKYLEQVIRDKYSGLLEIVDTAVDGKDLMEKLEICKPDIVLLDIKMPRMSGLEAAELIRKKYPDIQLVVISAYSDFSFAKQALKLGVSDYLLKPYLDSELRETLDKVIARLREREDSLALLAYSGAKKDTKVFDFYQDLEKDLLWNLFFKKIKPERLKRQLSLWEIEEGWMKVVLISSPALCSMGDFSREVLKNYFQMPEVKVLNSIWMDQMAICLYSKKEDGFTELTGCIRRAKDYLSGENQIPVACGVSGAWRRGEELSAAYEEAASYIIGYYGENVRETFETRKKGIGQICDLEEEIGIAFAAGEKERCEALLTELIESLEVHLTYQDMAVKLNFGRSLMTIIRTINQMPGIRVRTSEAIARFEKLVQLNFNGDNLKYHVDFFAEMEIQREDLGKRETKRDETETAHSFTGSSVFPN